MAIVSNFMFSLPGYAFLQSKVRIYNGNSKSKIINLFFYTAERFKFHLFEGINSSGLSFENEFQSGHDLSVKMSFMVA